MANTVIKYALHRLTGKSVFISDAENGLACNCKCEKCNERLEAIQGKVNEWHFRHHKDINCLGAQETAIHRFAKEIIITNFQISIPGEVLCYSEAKQEEKLGSIIPDVTIVANDENIYFEIVVTNPVDSFKELFYISGQHKSIEIDLTSIPYNITPQELTEVVLLQVDNKRKIFWVVENFQSIEESKNKVAPQIVENYKANNTNESWWTKLNSIKIGLFIAGIFVLLYQVRKLLTSKKRR